MSAMTTVGLYGVMHNTQATARWANYMAAIMRGSYTLHMFTDPWRPAVFKVIPTHPTNSTHESASMRGHIAAKM